MSARLGLPPVPTSTGRWQSEASSSTAYGGWTGARASSLRCLRLQSAAPFIFTRLMHDPHIVVGGNALVATGPSPATRARRHVSAAEHGQEFALTAAIPVRIPGQ